MIWLLFSSLSMASVVLMPKPGAPPAKQVQMPFSQPSSTDDQELQVELRKTPRLKKKTKNKKKYSSKFAKSKKRKSKKIFEQLPDKKAIEPAQEQQEQDEDAALIYNNEVKFLNAAKTPHEARVPDSVQDTGGSTLEKVEKKYISKFIKMKISKQVTQALLDRTKDYEGTLALAPGGLLKMEITEPQKSKLVLDGKNIWVVDYPIDEAQNRVQILHSRQKQSLKEQAFLGSILSGGGLLKNFKIKAQAIKNDETKFSLIPKKSSSDIKALELTVDAKNQLITDLVYWDQLGNKTELKFKDQSFEKKAPKGFFKFVPPQNSDVSEL